MTKFTVFSIAYTQIDAKGYLNLMDIDQATVEKALATGNFQLETYFNNSSAEAIKLQKNDYRRKDGYLYLLVEYNELPDAKHEIVSFKNLDAEDDKQQTWIPSDNLKQSMNVKLDEKIKISAPNSQSTFEIREKEKERRAAQKKQSEKLHSKMAAEEFARRNKKREELTLIQRFTKQGSQPLPLTVFIFDAGKIENKTSLIKLLNELYDALSDPKAKNHNDAKILCEKIDHLLSGEIIAEGTGFSENDREYFMSLRTNFIEGIKNVKEEWGREIDISLLEKLGQETSMQAIMESAMQAVEKVEKEKEVERPKTTRKASTRLREKEEYLTDRISSREKEAPQEMQKESPKPASVKRPNPKIQPSKGRVSMQGHFAKPKAEPTMKGASNTSNPLGGWFKKNK